MAPFLAMAVLAVCSLPGRADELEKLLRRPPSPGSLALLAAHLGQDGVAEKLTLGLASPDAETRGTAARLVNLGGERALLPGVQEALNSEKDPAAAQEEIRTLAAVGGPSFDAALLAAGRRFSPTLDGHLARVLGRIRGPAAFALYFSGLRDLALSDADRKDFFRLATRGKPDALYAAAAMALGHRDPAAWQAVLDAAGEPGTRIGPTILITALSSPEPVFRGEAAWYLARSYHGNPPSNSAEMLEALGRGELAPGPDAGPELHFGAEVLRRVLGKPAVEDEAWIACLETSTTCHLDSDFEESPLVDYLTPRERVAVRRRNEKSRPPEVGPQRQASPPAPRDSLYHRITRVEPSGASCRRTARTLFLMSLAPLDDPDPVAHPTPYLALFDADTIQCPDILPPRTTDARPGPDLVRVRAKVVAPKLLKKVEPLYPRESRRKGEQGVSIYEAIISATGCIQELRLVRSSTPTLDIMGMEAVSRWSYAPATLDGRPVRVWLTVTVTYRLQ